MFFKKPYKKRFKYLNIWLRRRLKGGRIGTVLQGKKMPNLKDTLTLADTVINRSNVRYLRTARFHLDTQVFVTMTLISPSSNPLGNRMSLDMSSISLLKTYIVWKIYLLPDCILEQWGKACDTQINRKLSEMTWQALWPMRSVLLLSDSHFL